MQTYSGVRQTGSEGLPAGAKPIITTHNVIPTYILRSNNDVHAVAVMYTITAASKAPFPILQV